MAHAQCEASLELGKQLIQLLDGVDAKPNERARIATALAATVSELFVATLSLLDSDGSCHAMTLARSMLEAQVDLMLLGANPDHVRQMRFDDARQFMLVYGGFQAVIDDGTFGPGHADQLQVAKQVHDELFAAGVRKQSVKRKFELAGIAEEYPTVYGFLCSSAHNNLSSLTARHFNADGLVVNAELPDEMIRSICGMSLAVLIRALRVVPQFTDLDAVELEERITATEEGFEGVWADAE